MRVLALTLALCFSGALVRAETAQERLKYATDIFTEIMATPDKGIPQDLLEKAHCIVIVPGLKTAALGIGGKYGRGFAMCRQNGKAGWGAPGAVRIEGGSFGFQIGASSTDVVMLVMSDRGMKSLLEDKFTLGGNASVAAGPVGRTATAQTDAQLGAEILSWSRSKGVFAGIALEGATLRNDLDENKELYGKAIPNKDILMTNHPIPQAARPLVSALNKASRVEAANTPIESRAQDAVTDQNADRKVDTKDKPKVKDKDDQKDK
jgi:lipid-binding SYLF domain-containing protein